MNGVLTLLRSNKRMLLLSTVFTAFVILFEMEGDFVIYYGILVWGVYRFNRSLRFWASESDDVFERLIYSLMQGVGVVAASLIGLFLLPQLLLPLVSWVSDDPVRDAARYYYAIWVCAIAWSFSRLFEGGWRDRQLFYLEVVLAIIKAGQVPSRNVNFRSEFAEPVRFDPITAHYLRKRVAVKMVAACIVCCSVIMMVLFLAREASLMPLLLAGASVTGVVMWLTVLGLTARRLVWKQGRMGYYSPFDQSLAGGGKTGL